MYRACKAPIVDQWGKVSHERLATYYSPSGFVERFKNEAVLSGYKVGHSFSIKHDYKANTKGDLESVLNYLETYNVCTFHIKFLNASCRQKHICVRESKANVWCSVEENITSVKAFAFGLQNIRRHGEDPSFRLCSRFFTPLLQLFIEEHSKVGVVRDFVCRVKDCSFREKFCIKHYVQHKICRSENVWINEDLLRLLYKIIVEKTFNAKRKIIIKVDDYVAEGSYRL